MQIRATTCSAIPATPHRSADRVRPKSGSRPLPRYSSSPPPGARRPTTLWRQNPRLRPYSGAGYNWNGFYAGGHLGVAWGSPTGRRLPGVSGSASLFQTIDTFDEGGSFFAGVQGGYNYMLPNRILIGVEADASFPAWPTLPSGANPFGVSIGGSSAFTSPSLGPVSFAETVLASGTVRGRIGYAPGHWLFYATGGFAWTYDHQSLTQIATGATETPFLWRLGWAAGAGVEVPIAPHWTARLEYLFTDYGHSAFAYFGGVQPVSSDLSLQQLSVGLNYRFGSDAPATGVMVTKAPAVPALDEFSFHGQSTSSGRATPRCVRRSKARTVCRTAARAARLSTLRCSPVRGCGRAPSCGSIRKSTRASALPTRTARGLPQRRVVQTRC